MFFKDFFGGSFGPPVTDPLGGSFGPPVTDPYSVIPCSDVKVAWKILLKILLGVAALFVWLSTGILSKLLTRFSSFSCARHLRVCLRDGVSEDECLECCHTRYEHYGCNNAMFGEDLSDRLPVSSLLQDCQLASLKGHSSRSWTENPEKSSSIDPSSKLSKNTAEVAGETTMKGRLPSYLKTPSALVFASTLTTKVRISSQVWLWLRYRSSRGCSGMVLELENQAKTSLVLDVLEYP